jgi:hypothetical protein
MWTLLTCFPTLGYNCRSIKVREGIAILVNCTNFVIYFLLTCGLPIWIGFFSYKNVVAGFGNFLVLQGYLMGSMYGMDSILLWRNPYGVWKQLFNPYYSRNLSLNKFRRQLRILCKQGN